MAKDKKILKSCPLNDRICNDCEHEQECKKIVKEKTSIISRIMNFLLISSS